MNGFRITLLVLLALALGLMFYVVAVLLPARQEQYELHLTTQKISEYEQRNAEHRARLEQFSEDAEAPEVASARNAAEESARKQEQELTEAEESSVLAAARRQEEARRAKQAAEQAAQAPSLDPAVAAANAKAEYIGKVMAYDPEWSFLMFSDEGKTPVAPDLIVAVRRGDYILCEAKVDNKDEESGQWCATVKTVVHDPSKGMPKPENDKPVVGDDVVVSPFESSSDLRAAEAPAAPAPAEAPAAEVQQVEAELVPMP